MNRTQVSSGIGFQSTYEVSSVWRELPYDLLVLIIDSTNDKSTLRSWSCVNQALGLKAHRRLWKSFSFSISHDPRFPIFSWAEPDVLKKGFDCNTASKLNRLISDPARLIESLEMRIAYKAKNFYNPFTPTQPSGETFYTGSSLPFLQNVRDFYISGYINHSAFEKFLAMGAIKRLYFRLPLRETILHEIDPVIWQTVRSQAYCGGIRKFPYPIGLHVLANHQNLRVLSVHQFECSEDQGLAFAVRSLRLTELEVYGALASPLETFLQALEMDNLHLLIGSDTTPLPSGFPVTLEKLTLSEDGLIRYDQIHDSVALY